ncbi:MAG: acyl--CoA ligase [Clostridia bacterium]|nr:acyl--CoA ligase [Clostridia bacterium]
MKKQTIEQYLFEHAQTNPDKTAIISVNDSITNKELLDAALGYSVFLKRNGLTENGVVVTRAANAIEYAVLYLGVHFAHGVVCSLEKSSPDETVISVADQMNAQLVIANDLNADGHDWKVIARDVEADAKKDVFTGDIVFSDLSAPADILFTTGTTGASKGVELSHLALCATAENLIFGCGYEEDMLLIVPGPLNHANAIRKLFTSIINGNTVYILNGMTNVKAFFDILELPYAKIACCLPPAMIRFILTLSRDMLKNYKDKIIFIESASAPLPEPDRITLGKLLPKTRLIINYGSSEAASVTMYDCTAHPGLVNCIGRPMPNSEILIVDDQKNVIDSSKDHLGLIACKGDVNMICYVNAPELTKDVLVDGIVYTNDIGYIEDGFVYIIGRKGDVINVGGLKVAPTEVEEAALAFEGINECICIALPDKITGNIVKLLYVSDDDIDIKKLEVFLATKLEAFKIPKRYERVDEIRKTYNGKIDRKSYRV